MIFNFNKLFRFNVTQSRKGKGGNKNENPERANKKGGQLDALSNVAREKFLSFHPPKGIGIFWAVHAPCLLLNAAAVLLLPNQPKRGKKLALNCREMIDFH